MNALLQKLAELLAHIVGDPVHSTSASAIQTTLLALAHTAEEDLEEVAAAIEPEVDKLISAGRAITEEEWNNLKALASSWSPPSSPSS